MKSFLRAIEFFSRICTWTCGFLLLAATAMIGVEVVLRRFFSMSIGGADEISSYVLAIICSWSLGYALCHKSHVRIDVLYYYLPAPIRAILDTLALALFLTYMSMVTYFSWELLHTSIIRRSTANTPLQTPMWIPQSIWFLGLVGFTLIIVCMLAALIYYQLKGDLRSAEDVAGSPNVLEELSPPDTATPES
jgi:TRAP-type C4-dicarboxylate transport system permease small subunit